VSTRSHHQVAEVRCDAKGPRLSISGWFHGPPVPRPPQMPLRLPSFIPPRPWLPLPDADRRGAVQDGSTDPLTHWINPLYLRQSTLRQAAAQYASNASLELRDFLRPERYAELRRALGVQQWTERGPANMRKYRTCFDTLEEEQAVLALAGAEGEEGVLVPHSLPPAACDAVSRLYSFLTSWHFYSFVGTLVQAPLDGLTGAVRCFAHGDYSMVCDPEFRAYNAGQKHARVLGRAAKGGVAAGTGGASVIEVNLCFVENDETAWGERCGGYTSYMTSDEELLTVTPKRNALSVVCVEPSVFSFVKLVAHSAPEPLYDAHLQFRVGVAEDSGSDSSNGDDDQ
jgi:hypothetical protein